MARALYSIQCHSRLVPRLPALQRIINVKHPSAKSNQMTKALSTSYPSKNISIKCNSLSGSRPPFPIPHGNAPSNLTVTNTDDPQAIDTVLEFYSAIRNRNLQVLSILIADDCRCSCHFTPFNNVLQGKEHVVSFLTALFGSMGEYMQFEIETSCHGEGDNVGILWHLEWKGNHVPFGKGCTFHSCEEKEGKLLIRNMEMFMESLLKLGFLQLVLMGMLMSFFSKCTNLALKWIGVGAST